MISQLLDELGIDTYDDMGYARNVEDVINDIRDAYLKIEVEHEPLLTIELQNESSVPRVFYKGKEVTGKVNVSFDWDTADCRSMGGLSYTIESVDETEAVNKVERRLGDHMWGSDVGGK